MEPLRAQRDGLYRIYSTCRSPGRLCSHATGSWGKMVVTGVADGPLSGLYLKRHTAFFFFFFKVYFYWRLFYQSGAALVSYNYLWWWKCSIICFIQSDSHESHAAIKHLKCDQCDWETEFLTSFNSFKWPWAASGYSIGHARILDQNEESHKFVNTNQFLKSYVMFTGPWSWRMRDSYAIFWNGTSKKVFSPINRCAIL